MLEAWRSIWTVLVLRCGDEVLYLLLVGHNPFNQALKQPHQEAQDQAREETLLSTHKSHVACIRNPGAPKTRIPGGLLLVSLSKKKKIVTPTTPSNKCFPQKKKGTHFQAFLLGFPPRLPFRLRKNEAPAPRGAQKRGALPPCRRPQEVLRLVAIGNYNRRTERRRRPSTPFSEPTRRFLGSSVPPLPPTPPPPRAPEFWRVKRSTEGGKARLGLRSTWW